MVQYHKQIGIMGLGNLLLGDEGFGVHCVQYLEQNFQMPEHLHVIDGGTAGILLTPFIEQCDLLYVIDVVNLEDEPGSIHCFTDAELRSGGIQTRMSPHQIGMLEILELCQIRGEAPERVHFITVVPASLEPSLDLSPVLERRVHDVVDILFHQLKDAEIAEVYGELLAVNH